MGDGTKNSVLNMSSLECLWDCHLGAHIHEPRGRRRHLSWAYTFRNREDHCENDREPPTLGSEGKEEKSPESHHYCQAHMPQCALSDQSVHSYLPRAKYYPEC